MWWLEVSLKARRGAEQAVRIASVVAIGAMLAGCFQPLYGEKSLTGDSTIKTQLAQVEIAQIPAPNGTTLSRLAVEVRNGLVFGFAGGGYAPPPTHRLNIRLVSSELSVLVDIRTARPDVNNVALNASYDLVELKTGKVVLRDQTFSRVSYDIPGQEQRFARARGLRDAENRAAKVITDNIQARLASYFVAGT
jgi:LPS-assembly lipoprotein